MLLDLIHLLLVEILSAVEVVQESHLATAEMVPIRAYLVRHTSPNMRGVEMVSNVLYLVLIIFLLQALPMEAIIGEEEVEVRLEILVIHLPGVVG
jgi:hypothetical protein